MNLIIVSGLSGSGKSIALHALEDLGYFCIDNLPFGMLPQLVVQLQQRSSAGIDNVAVKGRMEPVRVYEVLGREGYQLSTAQQAFVKGLEYYGQRAFEQALESFRSGAREDGPCAAFVARCEHYIRTPPSPEWDGAWQATSK